MTIVINSNSAAITINDTEHRLVTANGIITGSTPVTFTSNSDLQTMTVMGAISGTSRGIWMRENDIVTIGSTGLVEARDSVNSNGIYASGANALLEVSGRLYGEDIGVIGELVSDNLEILVNEGGYIGGGGDGRGDGNGFAATLALFGQNTVVTNFGTIAAELNQETGQRVAFTSGTFDSSSPDFFDPEDAFVTSFVNGGVVIGDIRFQAGNDEYRGVADGVVKGRIEMGTGNDDMIGSTARDVATGGIGNDDMRGRGGDDDLRGQAGADTIKGGQDDDFVTGGDGGDTVMGGAGDDVVNGGRGSDTIIGGRDDDALRGGTGNDTFVFKGNFGNDEIGDFAKANGEKIDLSGVMSIRHFNDLNNNHLSQAGGNTVIEDGFGNSITLMGVSAADLQAGDFIF